MDPNTTPRAEEPDSRNSLRHILATEPSVAMEDLTPPDPEPSLPPDDDDGQDDRAPKSATSSKGPGSELPMYTATTTTTRRNANGSVSSVYSGNKIRHLKKDDGIPLWRRDIQYDFLRYVFEDDQRVFHKVSDGTGGHTFADIYLDAMAKSSKCSKILKDKLLTERAAAINMAMVCLLVNVGRMNTTLNFFPEMRAQLRTYHSIPSLQAHQDPNAYKQLQDAPRLKSILKGATEDIEQPSTIEDIKNHSVPRTNPVNLIFVLAQYAPKISEIHFYPPRDFFDLVMRSALSSRSRATAFLWLMWWYLESDFTSEAAQNNPFGPGLPGTEGDATGGMPIKCPAFKHLTEDEMALENVDTDEEKNFGDIKRKERIAAILASDMAPVVTGPKRTGKKAFNQNPVFSVLADDGASTPGRDHQSPSHGSSKGGRKSMPHAKSLGMDYASETDRTRSPSPHQGATSVYGSMTDKKSTPNMRINTLLNDETPSVSTPPKGPGRGNWSRNRNNGTVGRSAFKNKLEASQDGTSPSTNGPTVSLHTSGPHGFYLPLNGSDPSHKRSRPLTQHQLAVEQFRRKRVEVILDRGLRDQYKVAKRRREDKGAFWLAWLRCKLLPDGYDTDEDENEQAAHYGDSDIGAHGKHIPLGFGGLLPVRDAEEVDCGEEAYSRAKIMNRVARRLERWEGGVEAIKRKKKNGAELVWVDTEGEREERGDSQMDYENGDGDVDDQMDEDDREMLEAAGVYDSEDEQMDDYDRELEAAEQS